MTDCCVNIAGTPVNILAGSSVRLLADLRALAPELGIGLGVDVLLDDETAKRIDDMQPLHGDDDTPELIEDWRTVWLLMHEAALMSVVRDVPICLAG